MGMDWNGVTLADINPLAAEKALMAHLREEVVSLLKEKGYAELYLGKGARQRVVKALVKAYEARGFVSLEDPGEDYVVILNP